MKLVIKYFEFALNISYLIFPPSDSAGPLIGSYEEEKKEEEAKNKT